MDRPTRKHINFVNAPITGKVTADVPGIGLVGSRRLAYRGYSTADSLLGLYLTKDEKAFISFMKENAKSSEKDARATFAAFKEWSAVYL